MQNDLENEKKRSKFQLESKLSEIARLEEDLRNSSE